MSLGLQRDAWAHGAQGVAMGTGRTWNTGSVPRRPGNTKSKRDHNSVRLFWMGLPDRMMRCGVSSDLHASVTSESGFLMRCPSSSTT